MSELIVDMPMPTVCDECPMMYDGVVCMATGTESYPNRQARILKNGRVFDPCENRLDDCPIIGVLPEQHGDLIDRDEIFSAIKSRVALIDSGYIDSDSVELTPIDRFERDVLCTCLHDVVCAKAVIAAERRGDD